MSYVGYGQSPYVQEPKVRFEAIGEAWALTREKMGVWATAMVIYGLIMGVIMGVVLGVLYALQMVSVPTLTNPNFMTLPGRLIFNACTLVFGAFLQAGVMRMALKQVRGEDIQVSDLFSAGDVVGHTIGTQLIYGIATYIGTLLCFIPGFIVMGRGMLAMPLTVDQRIGGFAALRKSWDVLKNETMNAILLSIAASFVSALGLLLLGIGVLITAPIYPLALAIVYRDFFDQAVELRGPTLNVPLPPSSAYAPGQSTPTLRPPQPGQPLPYGQNPGDMSGGTSSNNTTPPAPPQAPGQMGRIDM